MKKIILITVLGFLISVTAFGSYFEIGGSPITSIEEVGMMGIFVPPNQIHALPAYLSSQVDFVYGIPIYNKNLSVTVDLEDYTDGLSDAMFASGSIGARYTSDPLGTFIGPLRMFAGINGGELLWLENESFPFVTADAGISFKLTNNVRTFWDLKFYSSLWKDIHYSPAILLLGGVKYTF